MTTTTNAVASDLLERNRTRLSRAQEHLSRIGDATSPFTEANVLRRSNEMGIEVATAASECGLLAEVHPDPDVRAAADTIIQELSAFTTRLGQDRPRLEVLGARHGAAL